MAWDPIAELKGPQGDPGSDADIAVHEAATDPHSQYVKEIGDSTIAGDLTLQGVGKAYRFRRSGSALDLEGAGASLFFSIWDNGDFTGAQNNVFIADVDGTIHIEKAITVPTPTAGAHATSKDYVDNGLAAKQSTGDYATNTALTNGLAGKANTSHTHAQSDVTGLSTALSGKSDTGHTHSITEVQSLQTALDGKQPAGSYAAAVHTHSGADITSGTIQKQRLPSVINVVRTVAQVGGFIDIDASIQGNTIKTTLNSVDATLNVPTLGSEDQILQGVVYASTAQRILTFASGLGRLTGISATLTIPAGKIARYVLRRTDITGSAKWLIESVGVEQ